MNQEGEQAATDGEGRTCPCTRSSENDERGSSALLRMLCGAAGRLRKTAHPFAGGDQRDAELDGDTAQSLQGRQAPRLAMCVARSGGASMGHVGGAIGSLIDAHGGFRPSCQDVGGSPNVS